jgi:hypothetical protein
MTIREGSPGTGADPVGERVRRPEPGRTTSNRSGAAPADGGSGAATPDGTVSETIAQAVRMGYDVIAENLQQGREAAARFRQGDYNIRDVPGDLEDVLGRLIGLARELSTTTFDVCERLLKELGSYRSPEGPSGEAPPFRTTSPQPAPAPGATAAAGRMKLSVRFDKPDRAVTKTETLDRPRRPTRPQDLVVGALTRRGDGDGAIAGVTFETDVSVEGLVAVVALPDAVAAGVYSGLVYAPQDDVPLGVLAIEVLAPKVAG